MYSNFDYIKIHLQYFFQSVLDYFIFLKESVLEYYMFARLLDIKK